MIMHQESQKVINRAEFGREHSGTEREDGRSAMSEKSLILLVDRDDSDSVSLCGELRKAGLAVIHTDNGTDALSLLELSKFHILLVNIRLARTDGVDLIEWARGRYPGLRIAALCDFESSAVKRAALGRGADLFLNKPVTADEISGLLHIRQEARAFSGELLGFDILECLQFMLLTGKTMILNVTSTEGVSGEIYLKDGQVWHAESGDIQGEPALYKCMSLEQGNFSCLPWREPETRTIFQAAECLLFEAARIRDEMRGTSLEWTC